MRPALSVLIATQGRSTLPRALRSIRDQASYHEVEIVLVADTHELPFSALADIVELADEHDATLYEHDAGFHWYGHPQLQYGMEQAQGLYVAAIGDDDEYVPGALDVIREAIEHPDPPGPLLFRAVMKWGEVLWDARRLAEGRISAQNIVAPNVPGRLGIWATDRYAGDFTFIAQTVAAWQSAGLAPAWRDDIVVRCH
jgi:Glycosyl transferase family 2